MCVHMHTLHAYVKLAEQPPDRRASDILARESLLRGPEQEITNSSSIRRPKGFYKKHVVVKTFRKR